MCSYGKRLNNIQNKTNTHRSPLAPPQPRPRLHSLTPLSATARSPRGAPPRYAARDSLQQDPVADDDDANTDASSPVRPTSYTHDTTRERDVPHAQHHTRTSGPPRTTTTRLAPRAPLPMWTTHENNGEQKRNTSRESRYTHRRTRAKHVTGSETRHRNKIRMTHARNRSRACNLPYPQTRPIPSKLLTTIFF